MVVKDNCPLNRSRGYISWLAFAKNIQQQADTTGIGVTHSRGLEEQESNRSLISRFDELVTDHSLCSVSRKLFSDGHYARSVEEAFKRLSNAVQAKTGIKAKDGASLMRQAFSAHDPILKLNELRSKSEEAEQQGYMDLYAGSMTGIRNPRAHESTLEDDPAIALELLALANHLMRKLHQAKLDCRIGISS